MSVRRLFCPELVEGSLLLSAEESHHASVVLRLSPGEEVILFDGKGAYANGTLAGMEKKQVWVEGRGLQRLDRFDADRLLTLAVAFPKSQRQGMLVEKCAELGVAAILPLITRRSVIRMGQGARDKLQRRAIEACKQCGRCWVPVIHEPMSFPELLEELDDKSLRLFADRSGDPWPFVDRSAGLTEGDAIVILIGPEGGWADEERVAAYGHEFKPVSLSSHVLRTETAAIAACAQLLVNHERRDRKPWSP